jgi:trehalose 6-phosphate synthase
VIALAESCLGPSPPPAADLLQCAQDVWIVSNGSAPALRLSGTVPYRIRRIWRAEPALQDAFDTFVNAGLKALCESATPSRDAFTDEQFAAYWDTNVYFAAAVRQEAVATDPVVIVHDHPLALTPRMIRSLLPRSTIAVFWEPRWPEPDVLAGCSRRRELLEGLLGSDILGFHSRADCRRFMEAVHSILGTAVDFERSLIVYRGRPLDIQSYPAVIQRLLDCCVHGLG